MKDPVTPDSKKQGRDSDSDLNEEDSLKILEKNSVNQKLSEKKSDERFSKLSKTIRESKRSLEAYKGINDQKVQQVILDIDSTNSEMKDLKTKVEGLQQSLDQAHDKLNTMQK